MSYDPSPKWTDRIEYPSVEMTCPACGKVPLDTSEVMDCLKETTYYVARHIPPKLTFTCDNPDCPSCDKNFKYALSVVISAQLEVK